MAEFSTTVRGIPIRFSGGYWARCQLHAGIKYVSTRSISMELQAGDLTDSMADYSIMAGQISILYSGDCWARRQLHAGLKYVLIASKLRKSLSSLEGVSIALVELCSIAHSFTTVIGIPILFARGYWARRQLHVSIRYVPVASKVRISLASMEGRHF